MMAEPDDDRLNYPVYFFDGLLAYENEQIWDISRSQLEMIDVEVSASDDEVSLSDYALVKVDEYEIGDKTKSKETNEVCKTVAQTTDVRRLDAGKTIFNSKTKVTKGIGRTIKIFKYRIETNPEEDNTNSTIIYTKNSALELKKVTTNKSNSGSALSNIFGKSPRKHLLRPGRHYELDMEVAKWCPHLECVLCKELFSNFWILKVHFRRAHPDTKPFIICCGRKIFQRCNFLEHIRTRHKEAEIIDVETEEYEEFIQHYMPSMKCSMCNVERSDFSMLIKHFKIQHPNEICSILCCKRRFARLSTIEEHIRCHIDANTFECALCDQLFLTRLGLKSHMISDHYVFECSSPSDYYHTSISEKNTSVARLKYKDLDNFIAQLGPSLECTFCSLTFLTFTFLKQHFKDSHPIDKCQVLCCDIKFNNRHDLEEHLHLHRDPTGFKCQVCPNRFVKRSALYQHMYTKHPFAAVGTNDNLHYEENIRPKKSEVLNNYRQLNPSLRQNSLKKLDAIIARHKLKVNCGECKNPLKSLSHLRNHFSAEHPEQKFYFSCCDEKLSTHYKISAHLKRRHNIQKKILPPVNSEHPKDDEENAQ